LANSPLALRVSLRAGLWSFHPRAPSHCWRGFSELQERLADALDDTRLKATPFRLNSFPATAARRLLIVTGKAHAMRAGRRPALSETTALREAHRILKGKRCTLQASEESV
jgi:hypothetical protein